MNLISFFDILPIFKDFFRRRYSALRSAFITFIAAMIALDQDLWALYAFIALPFTEALLRYVTSKLEFNKDSDNGLEKTYDAMFTFAFMYTLIKEFMINEHKNDSFYIILYLFTD